MGSNIQLAEYDNKTAGHFERLQWIFEHTMLTGFETSHYPSKRSFTMKTKAMALALLLSLMGCTGSSEETKSEVKKEMEKAGEATANAYDSAKESAADSWDKTKDASSEAYEEGKEMASDAFDDGKEMASDAYEDGKKMASDAYDATAESRRI